MTTKPTSTGMDPLTSKGKEIMSAMKSEYGPEKGESVFYASKNAGTISGVDGMTAGEALAKAGAKPSADPITNGKNVAPRSALTHGEA